MMFPKIKRIVDKDYLEIISSLRCVACKGNPPSDPHHITSKKAGGCDIPGNIIPLCREHHTQWHKEGPGSMIIKYPSVERWLNMHGRHDVIERSRR